ncbi:DUF3853 family protein [Microbulbifer elongatus]|uniref:DUF3853 family protein n=1 Tax=Microbulbifer elongatus TaxID=86173 RepID=UPI001CFE9553
MRPINQKQPINPQFLYRASECARLFGVSLTTWWRWSSSGKTKRGVRLAPRIIVWEGEYLLELKHKLITCEEDC